MPSAASRLPRWAVAAAVLSLSPAVLPQQASGGLVRDGEPPQLEILYTGDVIGYLDPCG